MFPLRIPLLAVAAAIGLPDHGISFDAPRDYYVEAGSIAIADFNKDGSPDVVSATHRIFLLLGRPDGTLQDPVQIAAGTNPVTALVVGDFNGDANPDLAAAIFANPGVVSIRLGVGDGSFEPPIDYPVASPPTDAVAGDFDGDGITDLATAHPDLGSGSFLEGVGDGTFQPPASFTLGGVPEKLVSGDFNGDAIDDLAVSDWFSEVGLRVFLSDGSGAFQPTWTLDIDPALDEDHLAGPPADYDKDGTVDLLVVVDCFQCGVLKGVYLFRGAGDGTFPAHVTVFAEDVEAVAVADFDGDGRADIAAVNGFAANVAILSGHDDGTFTLTRRNQLGAATERPTLAAADFNQDSKMDLAIGNVDVALLQIRMGEGDGTFRTATLLDNKATTGWIVSADFDRDGRADIAAAQAGTTSWIAMFKGNGDGTFAPKVKMAVPEVTHFGMAADVNGDTLQDLVLLSDENFFHTADDVWVYLGNGDGTFQPGMFFTSGEAPKSAALADFDGDSILDLAVVNGGMFSRPRPSLVVLRGLGGGAFGSPASVEGVLEPHSVAAADFNGDLRPDLVVTNQRTLVAGVSGAVAIFLNDGAGAFQPSYIPIPSPWRPARAVTGDLNGDARADLLLVLNTDEPRGGAEGRRSVLLVLLGKGNGTFESAGHYIVAGSAGSLLAVDLNGDLVLDVAVGGLSAVQVLTGRGDGTFVPAGNFSVDGDRVVESRAADFNGDSRPDLAVMSSLRHLGMPGVVSINVIRLLINTTSAPQ